MPDNELERELEAMLCPGALQLVMRDVSDDETLHCGVCGKPVLIRHGRVSLHARPVWVGVQEDS